jgi:predicted 3-demethylubiquinone-9 3-methyltransferase (glyoxalase superfamily)
MAINREGEAMNEITPCLWFDTEGEDAARRRAAAQT